MTPSGVLSKYQVPSICLSDVSRAMDGGTAMFGPVKRRRGSCFLL